VTVSTRSTKGILRQLRNRSGSVTIARSLVILTGCAPSQRLRRRHTRVRSAEFAGLMAIHTMIVLSSVDSVERLVMLFENVLMLLSTLIQKTPNEIV
jgi:hypothetical protein